MSEVFISYSRANELTAKRVESGLKAAGWQAWRDDQLPAHRAYSEIIEQKLQGASAVVVLWSAEAAQSQWVRAEADFARNAGKLVQAQLDDTLPPLPFNQIQCADLRGWRGNRKHRGWAKLADGVASVVKGEPPQPAERSAPSRGVGRRRGLALAVLALAAIAIAAMFLIPRMMGSGDERPRVAVLPFQSIGASNDSLVEGIWEDTRQAVARNPQLLVLGPHSSAEIARQGSGRARRAADYLLGATVRTAGDRVRVSASLVRAADGVQVWSQLFDRKLDDVFALQTEIAQQIEGRIRGRLARRGGVLPEHIATTGEAYLIYSEARAAIRRRQPSNYAAARQQLLQVVKLDPNFAPGWATLSVAEQLYAPGLVERNVTGKEAEAYARRAIALAPNLAAGHAALGFALGRSGPSAEAALRRAIELDPNDVESLNWLASAELSRGRETEGLKLYQRALQIEPLWWPAVLNRLALLLRTNQEEAVEAELKRLAQLDSPRIYALARIEVFDWRGDYSEALKLGLKFYERGSAEDRDTVRDFLASLLLRLGYVEEAFYFSSAPPSAASTWRNEPRGLDMFEARGMPPAAFWKIPPMTEAVSRSYFLAGRKKRLVELYRGAAASPEAFESAIHDPFRYVHLAPTVALALDEEGAKAEAGRMLAAVERLLVQPNFASQSERFQALHLARLRAAQRRSAEAEAALHQAVAHGWLPEAPLFKPDLREDPPLSRLSGRPRFERIRTSILDRLARERAELGPIDFERLKRIPPATA